MNQIIPGLSNLDLVTYKKADEDNLENLYSEAEENQGLNGLIQVLEQYQVEGDSN